MNPENYFDFCIVFTNIRFFIFLYWFHLPFIICPFEWGPFGMRTSSPESDGKENWDKEKLTVERVYSKYVPDCLPTVIEVRVYKSPIVGVVFLSEKERFNYLTMVTSNVTRLGTWVAGHFNTHPLTTPPHPSLSCDCDCQGCPVRTFMVLMVVRHEVSVNTLDTFICIFRLKQFTTC